MEASYSFKRRAEASRVFMRRGSGSQSGNPLFSSYASEAHQLTHIRGLIPRHMAQSFRHNAMCSIAQLLVSHLRKPVSPIDTVGGSGWSFVELSGAQSSDACRLLALTFDHVLEEMLPLTPRNTVMKPGVVSA